MGPSPFCLRWTSAAMMSDKLAGWREEGVIEYVDEVKAVRPVLADRRSPRCRRTRWPAALDASAMSLAIAVVTTDVPGCRETDDGPDQRRRPGSGAGYCWVHRRAGRYGGH